MPMKPFCDEIVMVEVAELPGSNVMLPAGFSIMPKSHALRVTVKECDRLPLAAVTVTE